MLKVRRADENDLDYIANINSSVFLGDRNDVVSARKWAECQMRSFPLYHYFMGVSNVNIIGYIGWQLHGGFLRPEPVIELEQIGIIPAYQGQKFAGELIRESLREMTLWIQKKNNRIESHISVVVWAYTLNLNAVKAYAELFGDGPQGMRIQYGSRAETMLRWRIPMIRPVRE